MKYYNLGYYHVSQTEKSLDISFGGADSDESKDKKLKVLLFLLWGAISAVTTVIPILTRQYAHAVLFFAVFGAGGFYICINLLKRVEMKYFHLIIDKTGICEDWRYPTKRISKHITWEELCYARHFEHVVARAGTPSLPYDCLVFSNQVLEDQNVKRFIRRTWRRSMQYELLFREQRDSIYLMIESKDGEQLCALVQEWAHTYSDKEVLL